MRKLIFLSVILILAGCQQQTANQGQGTDTTETKKAGTGGGMLGMPGGDSTYNAVVIGSGVRSRNTPSLKGAVLRAFEQGELVKVVETTPERTIVEGKHACDEFGYPWCKVRDHEGKESWIFGKYVFRFQQMRSQKGRVVGGQELPLFGETHVLQLAADQAFGPAGEDGITACDNMYLPLLIKPGNHLAQLFYLDTKKITDQGLATKAKLFDTGLLLFYANSDGGVDEIEEVNVVRQQTSLEFEITHYYQDGHSKGILTASVSKQRVDVVKYENEGPQM